MLPRPPAIRDVRALALLVAAFGLVLAVALGLPSPWWLLIVILALLAAAGVLAAAGTEAGWQPPEVLREPGLALVLALTAVRAYAGPIRHDWPYLRGSDQFSHAVMAQQMLAHGSYTTYLIYPPGFSTLTAVICRVSGLTPLALFPVLAPALLVLTTAAAYALATRLWGWEYGLVAAALSGLVLRGPYASFAEGRYPDLTAAYFLLVMLVAALITLYGSATVRSAVLVAVIGGSVVLYHSVATLYLALLLAAVAIVGLPYLLLRMRRRGAGPPAERRAEPGTTEPGATARRRRPGRPARRSPRRRAHGGTPGRAPRGARGGPGGAARGRPGGGTPPGRVADARAGRAGGARGGLCRVHVPARQVRGGHVSHLHRRIHRGGQPAGAQRDEPAVRAVVLGRLAGPVRPGGGGGGDQVPAPAGAGTRRADADALVRPDVRGQPDRGRRLPAALRARPGRRAVGARRARRRPDPAVAGALAGAPAGTSPSWPPWPPCAVVAVAGVQAFRAAVAESHPVHTGILDPQVAAAGTWLGEHNNGGTIISTPAMNSGITNRAVLAMGGYTGLQAYSPFRIAHPRSLPTAGRAPLLDSQEVLLHPASCRSASIFAAQDVRYVVLYRYGHAADLAGFRADPARYRRVFENPSVVIYAPSHAPGKSCPATSPAS